MVVDGYGSYQYGDKATPNPDPKSQGLDPIKPNQLISSVPTRRRTIEAFSCPRAHLPPPQNDRQAIVGSGVCSTLIHARDTVHTKIAYGHPLLGPWQQGKKIGYCIFGLSG